LWVNRIHHHRAIRLGYANDTRFKFVCR
jgi:hypothetical protein